MSITAALSAWAGRQPTSGRANSSSWTIFWAWKGKRLCPEHGPLQHHRPPGSLYLGGYKRRSTSWFIELPNTAPATGDFNLRLDADPAAASHGDDILVASASAWVCNEDYSDAPSTYGAPSHFISSTTYLGASAPDAEAGASPGTNADADDLTGTDDEEGITLPSMTQRQNVLVTAKVAGTGGYLQGWIDWDGSGTFEANEQVAPNLQDNGAGDLDSTTGTIQFSVSVPSYAVTTKTYARFRWSTVANLDAIVPHPW